MFTLSQGQKPSWLVVAMGLFVLLTCLRVWVGPMPVVQPARAQIPDAGTQRKLLVDEVRRTNQLLTDIKQILATRTLNVRIEGADNPSADNQTRPRKKPRGSGN